MKKLLLAGMLLFNLIIFAQSQKWEEAPSKDATTEKEYNYLTVGLKTQIASGFDIIDGYVLQKCSDEKIGNYNFKVQYLTEKKTDKLKAVSVIITSIVSGKIFYVCIPINNRILRDKYWQFLNSFEAPMAKSYAYMMGSLFTGTMVIATIK